MRFMAGLLVLPNLDGGSGSSEEYRIAHDAHVENIKI